jgi:hypothetical protein
LAPSRESLPAFLANTYRIYTELATCLLLHARQGIRRQVK